MTASVRWHGRIVACDLCRGSPSPTMYDCAVPRLGRAWGMVCAPCFEREDCRIGPGLGQRYERQPDGRWLRTGG